MRTVIVPAIDDEPGRAGLPYFSDGDFLSARHEQRSKRARFKLVGYANTCGGNGVLGQALDGRHFLAQAPLQKSALKL
jgi:hypothetical protein